MANTIDLLIEETGENLELVNFNLAFTSVTSEYVAQKIKIKLSFFLGEWFLDTTQGIPYLEEVFVKNPDIGLIEDTMKANITNIDGVQEIISFDIDIGTDRKLSITTEVRLTDNNTLTVVI